MASMGDALPMGVGVEGVGRKTIGALLGGAKTSSLWGDSSATGVGDALYGGGKNGTVRGGVGGQRLVHWKRGSSTASVVEWGGKHWFNGKRGRRQQTLGAQTAGALRGRAHQRQLLELGKPRGKEEERLGVIKTVSF